MVDIQNMQAQSMKVFNVLGEEVLSTKITKEKTEIDISTYPKGVYFVRIQNATQSINGSL